MFVRDWLDGRRRSGVLDDLALYYNSVYYTRRAAGEV